MVLLLHPAGCGNTCGEGTLERDGECVAAPVGDSGDPAEGDADTDADGDTDADSDADSDADGDTDADADTEPSGPCAPPDAWTGPVDPALYTKVAYDPSYDAGLAAIAPYMPSGGTSVYSDKSWLVYNATITAITDWDENGYYNYYIADANYTLVVSNNLEVAELGDGVALATDTLGGYYGERRIEGYEGWTVVSTENPVYVRELGADNLDYLEKFNEVIHMYGEVTRLSNYDCGDVLHYTCYIVAHDGTEDLIRVTDDNDWGLGADYVGGLCAEVVAPVNTYTGADGSPSFLDVLEPSWMRVWELQ